MIPVDWYGVEVVGIAFGLLVLLARLLRVVDRIDASNFGRAGWEPDFRHVRIVPRDEP